MRPQMAVVGKHGKRYLEASEPAEPRPGQWGSFEELVEWSGMLEDRPPVATGETGVDHYIVQPFQLLSIYPRAYLYPRFINDTVTDRFIEIASKQLSRSGLALRKGEKMTEQECVSIGVGQGAEPVGLC